MKHFNKIEKNSLLENYLVEFCFDEEHKKELLESIKQAKNVIKI